MRNPLSNQFAVGRILGLALALALFIGDTAAIGAGPEPRDHPRPARADRYVVVYDNLAHPGAETNRLERAHGFDSTLRYATALDGFAARLSPGQLRAIERDPEVAYVSPDYRVEASEAVPLAAGEPLPPTGVRRVEAATSSAVHAASGARVAVLDSGIDLDHPDLNVADGRNCVDPGAPADDDNGHGTHVAGTIGGKNDGSGVVGVAPGTRVVAVKVLDANGDGTFSQIICGIDWITATRTDADPANDIAVANMSLGGAGQPVGSCATTTDPMHQAICRSTSAQVAYVVAAGNSGWDFDYARVPDLPAAYPQVLTVSAIADSDGLAGSTGGSPSCEPTERDDRYASFSNYAATSAGAAHTIAAPGTCINSTWPGGGYKTISGTSMATPHVAGATALCLSEGSGSGPCAGLSPAQITQKMRSEAEAHTLAQPAYGFAGDPARPLSGRYYGYLGFAPLGTAEEQPPAEPPPAEPTFSDATATPFAAVVQSGSVRSGTYGRLAADDGSYYQVNSTSKGTRTAAWYARLGGITNDLRNLSVAYSGRNSATCAQTLAFWRWTTNSWVQVDSRSVGGTEVTVKAPPPGAAGDYVSGAAGQLGEVRVRVRCTRSSSGFYTSADALRLDYQAPTA